MFLKFLFLLVALTPLAPLPAAASVSLATPDTSALSSGLIGYWSMDGNTISWSAGTMKDLSGNGNTATLVSFSPATSPVAGKIGGALAFNGSSQYVRFTSPVSGTPSQLTLCSWLEGSGSGTKVALSLGSSGTDIIWLGVSGGKWELVTASNNFVSSSQNDSSGWHHICGTIHGTSASLYVDGVFSSSASGLTISSVNTSGMLGQYGGGGFFWPGAIDDVRIYTRVVSAQEIAQLYAAGQVNIAHSNTTSGSGINAGLVGYWTFDGPTINWNAKTIADVSGKGDTLTMNGFNVSTSTAPVPGKIGQALKFNNSQELSHGNISAFNFGTGDFSVSFWMKPVSPWGSGTIGILGQKTGDTYNGWQIYQDSGHTSHLDMRITQQNNFVTNGTVPNNVWTYATFVRKSGNVYWYLNGSLDNSGTNSSSISDPGSFYIGYAPTWNAYYPGAFDDIRIYGQALSAQEVQQLYQMGR